VPYRGHEENGFVLLWDRVVSIPLWGATGKKEEGVVVKRCDSLQRRMRRTCKYYRRPPVLRGVIQTPK